MINEDVRAILANGMWDLATCANDEPNVIPVAFKDVTDDGKLTIADGTSFSVTVKMTVNAVRPVT